MIIWNINYLAVLVAAIATFLLGGLWYSPLLFAKPWMKYHGYTPENLSAMQKGMGRAYGGSFVAYLVMAFVVAQFVNLTGSSTVSTGITLGALIWLGFAATIGLTANLFSDKHIATYIIDAGYQLVYLILMGAILAVWP